MFTAPEPAVRDRMLSARGHACDLLGLADTAGGEVWGYAGRTLSGAVRTPTGVAWLRLVSDPRGKSGGKLWEGPREAERAVPPAVPRPRLLGLGDWSADGWDYRAEHYEFVATPPVAKSPVLHPLHQHADLPDTWWQGLHQALAHLALVRTDRQAVREQYIRRRVPEFTGVTPGEITWATAHGDLHWANLTGPALTLLDWEGWGTAPLGYDAATLYLHSLPAQDVAERVRKEFAHVLDTPDGRIGELTACTEILQAAPRVPFYAGLADGVRQHLRRL
ncbi:hypothetical protein SAMN05428945_1914 [Streptomyces sp. 2224.1]|nr:hypothetical protein BX261_3412 [Streptomyces sp. 2321.6]SDR42108.1 hypothetical protein SAMN05216511_3789 [Streptomyces sp. KS_16]SEC06022.1 hypothetical protein SAMN05428945_1914 [Streptomyces sp. 2224.1]SEC97541.1 hypothetical protein SAMN05428940_3413 [Streptomyces sp. 2133.1]SEE77544.1 hypothetical protein SAMN05428954_3839 [Streptomyces sp. 2112.3]SNC69542.1 hypothetical protein SAMN06272741_3405 [Streptomyces sp. 2114.4]